MRSSRTKSPGPKNRATGFSLTELVVAMAIGLVLMTVSMPMFLRIYHAYQLTNAASQLADILRLTRYEAIRRNAAMNCVIKPMASDPTMSNAFADLDGDTLPGPLEEVVLLGSGGNLVDAGTVPGTATLLATARLPGAVTIAPGTASIGFDARGAVRSNNVTVFYLGSALAPEAGFRAVVLLPAGTIQIWTADTAGLWGQLR